MARSAQSSSKRRKRRRKPDRNGIDRLSNLPDHILLHILSFVPTETATATSVLSKSWQFLWTLVINLDFDESRSHPRHTYEDGSFANFVNKVLLHRRERFIGRFRLKCHSYLNDSDVDSWVSSAVAQNVQELDLELGHDDTYYPKFMSPCTQQSWKNLVVLKLRSVVLGEVSFPALKIFHLDVAGESQFEVEYQEIKFLPSRFTVLEELVIVHEFGFNKANFEIYLPKLRSLAIDKRTAKAFVRIDCPALTHISIKDENSRGYHLENLLSLVEADINVRSDEDMYNKDQSYVTNVVKAISNVRIMRIFHHTMKEIIFASFRGDDIPVFHNLVRVELPFVECCAPEIITMLQKFQHLECLILWYEGAYWEGGYFRAGRPRVDMKEFIQQTHVPNCLTSRLTSFCFRQFKGTNDEMEVTRYVLENSLVLKYMTIFLSSSLNSFDKGRIQRKIRESPACEGCRFDFF